MKGQKYGKGCKPMAKGGVVISPKGEKTPIAGGCGYKGGSAKQGPGKPVAGKRAY